MTTALAAALLAALLATALLATLQARSRYARRLEQTLHLLDEYARSLSSGFELVAGRASAPSRSRLTDVDLILDLDAALAHVAERAALLVGAPAAAFRVESADGDPRSASFGPDDADTLLARIPVPPDALPSRALAIGWTSGTPALDDSPPGYRSALVVPISCSGTTGVLVVCAMDPDAFRAEDVDALERLAAEAAPAVASARLFARIERRVTEGPPEPLPRT